jgi:hypothetical protein
MPVKRYKVEKVPLTYHPTDHAPVFPPFPVLYLELIENKEKVIPGLKDKQQDPIFLPQVHTYEKIDSNKEFFSSNPERDMRNKLQDRLKRPDPKPPEQKEYYDRQSVKDRTLEREYDVSKARELSTARQSERQSYQESSASKQPVLDYSASAQDYPPAQENYSASDPSYQAPPPDPPYQAPPDPPYQAPPPEPVYQAPPVQPVLNATESSIRSMLGGTQSEPTHSPPAQQSTTTQSLPPTLSQINSAQVSADGVKNLTYTNSEDEVKRKRELLFRFEILKRSYKDANIPEFNEFTDMVTMERVYEDTVRRVGLEAKVEGYKKFLTMGFFGIEFLFTNFLKVDMSGFAKQQMSTMGTYERLLIELGEKAMLEKSKSQWPVEIRLLFTIIMNAVIFLLMKNVMSGGMNGMMGSMAGAAIGAATSSGGGGGDGMGMMSGLMSMMSGLSGGGGGGGASASTASVAAKPKQKMKGPSINLDDK